MLPAGEWEAVYFEEEAQRIPYASTGGSKPAKAHRDDAGFDLCATEGGSLAPAERAQVPLGIKTAIPEGYAGLMLSRSGLALKHGVTILNSPGLIDAGFRGEWTALLHNTNQAYSGEPFTWQAGDRIAQLVVIKLAACQFEIQPISVFERNATLSARGEGGFGSTGVEGHVLGSADDEGLTREQRWDNEFYPEGKEDE